MWRNVQKMRRIQFENKIVYTFYSSKIILTTSRICIWFVHVKVKSFKENYLETESKYVKFWVFGSNFFTIWMKSNGIFFL